MTLRDIDDVFSPDDLGIIVGYWNEGNGFTKPEWSGTLGDVWSCPFADKYIEDIQVETDPTMHRHVLVVCLQDED